MLHHGSRLARSVGSLFARPCPRLPAPPSQQQRFSACLSCSLARQHLLGLSAATAAAAAAAVLSFGSPLPAALRSLRSFPTLLSLAGLAVPASPAPSQAALACEALLRTSVRTPFSTYTLGGLYTVELEPPRPGAPVLVLLSGYSSGSGLYYSCLDHLAQHYHVLCVDVLGTGASERPPFAAASVEEGEAFFVAPLERWRALRFASSPGSSSPPPPRLTLAGHSLGGYLAAAYALRHPSAVEHLVLVNAAGIPEAGSARLAAARERHWAVGAVGWAWEAGLTPGSVVRALGPLGASLVEGTVSRRFARMGAPPPELQRYVQAILSAPGSGEHALRVLLHFGGHAKAPMGPRLRASWRGKTTVLHGEHDWMDLGASARLARTLAKDHGVDAAFVTVPRAEHYVFLERPREFAAALAARA
jgi:pimeloyl-ACP methyl ester carboxylesterase